METKRYLKALGDNVYGIRKDKKMNQVEFYNFLFPDNALNDENKKKKMNMIENSKQTYVDWELLIALCEKCDVSADYILGLQKDYSSHEREFICDYTGLEEKAVKKLHKWNLARNNGTDVSKLDDAFCGDDADAQYNKTREKQEGLQLLKIINYLFTEGVRRNPDRRGKKEPYTNLTILYALYMLTLAKPEIMDAYLSEESLEGHWDIFNPRILEMDISKCQITVDASKPFFLRDSTKLWHFCSAKQIIELYARKELDKSIDRLVEQLRKEE